MAKMRIPCTVLAFVSSILCLQYNAAAAKKTIHVETVTDYAPCGWSSLPDSNLGGQRFYQEMLRVNSLGFNLGFVWNDADVWDTDFLDLDLPGAPSPTYSNDSVGADQANTAISYFQGHGAGYLAGIGAVCTSRTDCTTPPPNGTGPGACVKTPYTYAAHGSGMGECWYGSARCINTCGTYDASYSLHAACQVQSMALGENPIKGAWAGAGTNGGASLFIFHSSYGLSPFFPNVEWKPAFAGLHFMAGTMPTFGDTCDTDQFGYAFAKKYSANPSGSVTSAYINSISSITDGQGCYFPGGTSYHGGFNGCGCNVIINYADTGANAVLDHQQNWSTLTSEMWRSTSARNAYMASWGCNYNVSVYSWDGGN